MKDGTEWVVNHWIRDNHILFLDGVLLQTNTYNFLHSRYKDTSEEEEEEEEEDQEVVKGTPQKKGGGGKKGGKKWTEK